MFKSLYNSKLGCPIIVDPLETAELPFENYVTLDSPVYEAIVYPQTGSMENPSMGVGRYNNLSIVVNGDFTLETIKDFLCIMENYKPWMVNSSLKILLSTMSRVMIHLRSSWRGGFVIHMFPASTDQLLMGKWYEFYSLIEN